MCDLRVPCFDQMMHGVFGRGAVIDLDGGQRDAWHGFRSDDDRRQRVTLTEKL